MEINTKGIVQAMSQVILKEEEIKGLKMENQKLVEAMNKEEEERKSFEGKNKELLEKNEKLIERLSGQLPVQGEDI